MTWLHHYTFVGWNFILNGEMWVLDFSYEGEPLVNRTSYDFDELCLENVAM